MKIAAGVVLCGLILAGCSSGGEVAQPSAPSFSSSAASSTPAPSSTGPDPISMIGDIQIPFSNWISATGSFGESCTGTGNYYDVVPGAQVFVSDATGATVAIGSTINGQVSNDVPRTCEMDFAVPDVPGGKGFYGVTVGSRAPVKVAEAAARANVSLTFS